MKFNKKSFLKSLYKISTVLFLVGYNFAPSILAIDNIVKLGINKSQSVLVKTEEGGDILDKGISDPEWIAKGSKREARVGEVFANSCLLNPPDYNCTANDVGLSNASYTPVNGDSCDFPGDTIKINLFADVISTASKRYDIGVWIYPNGLTGTCTPKMLPIPPAINLDSDTCGDVQSAGTLSNVPLGEVELTCTDTDGDGFLDVPVITSWENNAGVVCTQPQHTLPGTKSKCRMNNALKIPVPIPGQIIVKKETSPVDPTQEFDFSLKGNKNATFKLKNGENWDSGTVITGGLPEGTYSLTETNPTGWDLDTAVCTSSKGDNEVFDNINLDAGETVTCTFTNVKQEANLTLVKEVVNNNGGNAGANDFGISVNGDVVTSGVKGTYSTGQPLTINETGKSGYNFVSITGDAKCPTALGGTVTLQPGDDITCTIKNDDIAPSLTLKKIVENDYGDKLDKENWELKAKGETSVISGFGGAVSDHTFKAGTYTLSEVGKTGVDVSGYKASDWVCDGGTQDGNKITLGINESAICTITNKAIGPKLTVTKVVQNGLWGTKIISDFPLFVGNTPVTSGEQNTFNAGSYVVSETNQDGYTSVITGDCDANGNVTLEVGDVKSCTITNTSTWSKIIVKKSVISSANDITKFAFSGKLAGEIGHDEIIDKVVLPGTYTTKETVPSGWKLTGITCTSGGSGNLQTGESTYTVGENQTVSCTYTNTKLGSISGYKINDIDGDPSTEDGKKVPNWTIRLWNKDKTVMLAETTTSNEGDENDEKYGKYIFDDLEAGTYIVEEVIQDGWGILTLTLDKREVKLGIGENATNINFVNYQKASITVKKDLDTDGDGIADSSSTDWTYNVTSEVVGFEDVKNKAMGQSITALRPGTYTITENEDDANYKFHSLDCGDASYSSEKGTITLNLKSGENVTCTYLNTRKKAGLVVNKVYTPAHGSEEEITDFSFTVKIGNGEAGEPVAFEADGKNEITGLLAGDSYDVKEVPVAGYNIEYSNGCTGTIPSEGNAECTITNTPIAPTLKIVKDAINNNGGNATVSTFGITLTDTPLTFEDGTPIDEATTRYEATPTVVANKTYTLSELDKTITGYEQKKLECLDGEEDLGATFELELGQNVVCTITNNDIAPELTVIKKVINEGNDGTKSAGDFAITVTGTNVSNSNFQGSENGVTVTLNAGSYKVTEDEDTEDYTASYDNCEGTINIGEKKTCTITNTGIDHLPSIVVTKDADKTAVNETGEDVTFTFTVKNTSKVDTVTILSLVDSKFGTLAGDDDCKVGTELVPGASCSFTLTKTIKGDAIGPDHENIFKATVKDEEGNETSDEDNHIIEFNDVLPTVEVTKDADKTSVDETGENVTFTFTVKNTSDENVTIATLTDSVFGTLVGDTDCKVGTELVPDASCTFTLTKLIKGDASGPDHENTFKAEVTDNEGNTAADTDTETIGFDDVLPTVEVTKEADKTSVDETGESVTFTFTVKNTSEENVTITTLTDSVFGALAGDDDCKVGTELAAGASCTFTLTKTIDGNASGPDHENVFTAVVTDNDGSTGEDTDNEIITFKDVEPSIEVTKTAGVTEIPETGGKVTFTYKVTNSGLEEVEITYLNDDQFGDLDGDDDCKVGTILGVGKSCTFAEEFEIPANEPGDPDAPTTHKNIFTAKAKDDEENEVEDEDTEEVKLTPVPSLKLVKNVVHKYNSDTNITAADWTLYATGDGGFDYAGDKDEFRFVKAGVPYTLSEEGIYSPRFEASNWVCNGVELTDSTIKLAAEDDVVCTITNTALPATVTVYKDVLDGYSNDIFKVQLEDGGKKLDISDTEDANKRLVAVFEGLDRGTYNPKEVELPDGYIAQGCVPLEGSSNTVENGMGIEFVCKNKVIDPLLQIEKSNDKQHIDQLAGNEVTYTIKVTAPADNVPEGTYILNNVIVSDIAPAGFKYISGSWTAQKNGVDIPVTEPTYNDANVAQWMIGDMKEGDVVVLTYRTRISLLQDPGNYPDIAWVAGTSLIDGEVLGASTVDPETPFVGTDVTVIEPDIVEEGEVLGASITLPDTGASTYLTLGALIMMILGVIALLFKPFKKLNYALLTGLMAVSFVTLLTPNRVLAEDSDIKVRIMQPATPTNKSSFNVGFVALDLKNNPITVECYKDAVLFETLPNVNTGNCPAKVDASGTYTFYVIAKSTSGEQKSADVTVVVDLEKPSPVIDYSKAGNVLKFKTANDGKTKKVEIHRSTTPKYTANESTRIHTMDVLPNTEYSWTDTTAETGKTYYYALRTVDAVGNVSTIVSDPEVKIVPPTTTGTGTTATVTTPTEGEVAGQTDTKKEGEVAGEADDLVEGEEKDVEKKEETKEDTKADLKETGKKILNKWYIWVVAILVLGGVAFYVKKQKSN